MKCFIDVLIPIYKPSPKYLYASINSIKSQTLPSRIICILNGMDPNSTDRYFSFLQCLPVDLIIVSPKKGVSAALNYGLSFCESEFIARQDDDDISHPSRFQSQVDFLNANPNVDVVGSSIYVIDKDDDIIDFVNYPFTHSECLQQLTRMTCFCHPSVMFRSSFFHNQRYPNVLSEDYALWLQGCPHYGFANIDYILYSWRRHEGQASSTHIPYIYLQSSLQLIKQSFVSKKIQLYFCLLLLSIYTLAKGRLVDFFTPSFLHR